tara:strand:- start:1171 stop:1335 length:165 start_codon:yes stop_codon:yes gene_type:complete
MVAAYQLPDGLTKNQLLTRHRDISAIGYLSELQDYGMTKVCHVFLLLCFRNWQV